MRTLFLILTFLPALLLGAVCKGEDPCKACKDCSQCRFCDPKSPQHGSCGTLRAQDAAAEKKRQQKRGKAR